MPDTLTIHGLRADCRLGVFEWEQSHPQHIEIDLELEIDAAKAAARDEVADAVDYGALVTAVKRLAEGRPFRLMETMAQEVASLILKEFATPQARVRVTKRALPGIESASVEIIRRKDG